MMSSAKEFAEYGSKSTKISVYYINKEDVKAPDISDVVYVKGTHGINHVEISDKNVISIFQYYNYKIKSTKLNQELKFEVADNER